MVSRSLLLHDIYSISWPGLGEGGLFTSQKPRTKKGAKVAVPVACSYVAIGCVCGTDWPDMLGECPVDELYLLLSLLLKGLPPPSAGWLRTNITCGLVADSHGSPNTKSEDTAGHSGTGFNPALGMWRPVDLYAFKTSLGHTVSLNLKQNKKHTKKNK